MSPIKMANVLCKIRCGTWKLLLRIYEPFKVHEHSDHLWSEILYFWWLNLVVCFCWGNHCWFIFVSWSGYCSVSFQSSVWRYLVITPIRDTKKLLNVLYSIQTDSDTSSCERNYIHYVQRAKKLHTLLTLISSSSYWSWLFIVSGLFYKILMLTHQL